MSASTKSHQPESREIRVFLSSTFRDMQAERDILVKKIFPQLRKLCEARDVTLTEVDLRWGITDEATAEGKVLPLCLDEIHHCRPYFIGLLGERYGWVPDEISPELLKSQSWLAEHLEHSVTEMEIQYGVFSNQPMHGHAFFYFRDPRWLDCIAPANRHDFTEENVSSVRKLRALKQKIREAANRAICTLREDYANPEQLGQWVLDDLARLVDQRFPETSVPDALDRERARHEASARNRRLAFIGRDDLLKRLNEHVVAGGRPMMLTGESGCGKSALLAEWTARWRDAHPDDLVIQHYIGSTPDSADWQRLVRRILGELKRTFAIGDEIPVQPNALRGALFDWIGRIQGPRRVVLVLDALNQLVDSGDGARQIGWLPWGAGANCAIVVSSLPGESLTAMRARNCAEMEVPLFCRNDIAAAAVAYFKVFSKTPPSDVVAHLEAAPAACNALFLRVVLDELRQFGRHDDLRATADRYLSVSELPALFVRILERWEQDFGAELVRDSLSLIWAARRGLSEVELLELLGGNPTREPIPRALWTPLFLACESSLAVHSGLLSFAHAHLRTAVEDRYLRTAATRRRAHERVAMYFEFAPIPTSLGADGLSEIDHLAGVTSRALDEEPWQLQAAERWDFLAAHLSFLPVFEVACATGRRFEWMQYWQRVLAAVATGAAPPLDVPGLYLAGFRQLSAKEKGRLGGTLGQFLQDLDYFDAARECFEDEARADGHSHDRVLQASNLNDRALIARDSGRPAEALRLFEEAAGVLERAGTLTAEVISPPFGRRLLASVLMNKASVLRGGADQAACRPLLERSLALMQQATGQRSEEVATVLQSMGNLSMAENDFAGALSWQIQAHTIRRDRLGPEHRDVGLSLANAANALVQMGRFHHAIRLWVQARGIFERTVGSSHHYARTVTASLEQAQQAAAQMAGRSSGCGVLLLVGNSLSAREDSPDPSVAGNARVIADVIVDALTSVWDDACAHGSSAPVLVMSCPGYADASALAKRDSIVGRFGRDQLTWLEIPPLSKAEVTPAALVPLALFRGRVADWLRTHSIDVLMAKPVTNVGTEISRPLIEFVRRPVSGARAENAGAVKDLLSRLLGKAAGRTTANDGFQIAIEIVPFDGLDGPLEAIVTDATGPRPALIPSAKWHRDGCVPTAEDKRATGAVYLSLPRATRDWKVDREEGMTPLDRWSIGPLMAMAATSHAGQCNVFEDALVALATLLETHAIKCPPERGARGFRRSDVNRHVEAMLTR